MRKIFLSIFALVIMISCKDEEVIINGETSTEIVAFKTENKGILTFKNFDYLERRINEIIERDHDLYKESRNEFLETGRISLLLAKNMGSEEAEKLGIHLKRIPSVSSEDQVLLYLLNANGEVVIDDIIFRIDGDFVYSIVPGGDDYVNEFLEAYNAGKLEVGERKLLNYNKYLKVYKHGNKKEKEVVKRTGYDIFPNDSSVRVKGRQYEEYWFFYSSVGALTKTEQYWSNWVNVETTNRLRFSVYFESFSIFDAYTPIEGKFLNDDIIKRDYAIDKVFGFSVGSPAPLTFKAQDGFTEHQAGWYGNNSQILRMDY